MHSFHNGVMTHGDESNFENQKKDSHVPSERVTLIS